MNKTTLLLITLLATPLACDAEQHEDHEDLAACGFELTCPALCWHITPGDCGGGDEALSCTRALWQSGVAGSYMMRGRPGPGSHQIDTIVTLLGDGRATRQRRRRGCDGACDVDALEWEAEEPMLCTVRPIEACEHCGDIPELVDCAPVGWSCDDVRDQTATPDPSGDCDADTPCPSGQICVDPYDACSAAGRCVEPRTDCTASFGAACGCDGTVYENVCAAHAAGVDVGTGASCAPPEGTFACGGGFCDPNESYCVERPDNLFFCRPLPVHCAHDASCATCFGQDAACAERDGGLHLIDF